MDTDVSIYRLIFSFILINCFLQFPALCQQYNRLFVLNLMELKLDYKQPKGFSEKDSLVSVKCKDPKLYMPTALIYSLVNEDSSIIIGFGNFIADRNRHDYDPIVNILSHKASRADSAYFKPIIYNKENANGKFNADLAVQYSKNCSEAFLSKYNNDMYVEVGKKGRGEFTIAFYFTDKAKDRAMELIKHAFNILKFKP